jgi:transposase
VQRNAMKVWEKGKDFKTELLADPEVTAALSPAEIEEKFDLGYHTKHVDTIFAKGTVWDEKTKTCIKAEESSLNDDQRFGAVRELAYAGRYDEATAVLAAMTEGETSA